ncbi:MAG: CrcB family protein [Oscillospiraceae bacterium]|jgi:CrcB protein|nr:CrcB family protein [Oscillospiraceae bacterium]
MSNVLAVGLGGFVGANLRYLLTKIIPATGISLATLTANVVAGLLIGVIVGLDGSAFALPPKWKLLVNTGLLGGLSTFSTFSMETVALFSAGKYALGAANAALNLGLSIGGVIVGTAIVGAVSGRQI